MSPGLSPRVRGNRGAYYEVTDPNGSIPACAGEPFPPYAIEAMAVSNWGLSPRVRGNLKLAENA